MNSMKSSLFLKRRDLFIQAYFITFISACFVPITLGLSYSQISTTLPMSESSSTTTSSFSTPATETQIPLIAPEISSQRIQTVTEYVSSALGDNDENTSAKQNRYASAREASESLLEEMTQSQLVYGELSIPVLARLLNAVGVQPNEQILDVGSGDGGLVLGSSILLAGGLTHENPEEGLYDTNYVKKVIGLEIVPGLYDRSIQHGVQFQQILNNEEKKKRSIDCIPPSQMAEFEFVFGDIYQAHSDASIQTMLKETTLVVCFATTWSAGNNKNADSKSKTSLQKRKLPQLSSALSFLPKGARAVIVDGKLNCEEDGFEWQGDLKIQCPDTAPYSIASLYEKINDI